MKSGGIMINATHTSFQCFFNISKHFRNFHIRPMNYMTSCYLPAIKQNPNIVGTPPNFSILYQNYTASIYILLLRSAILWDTHSFLKAVSIWALWKVWNIWDFCKIKCILSPASCSKTSLDPWTNGWKEKIFFSTSG